MQKYGDERFQSPLVYIFFDELGKKYEFPKNIDHTDKCFCNEYKSQNKPIATDLVNDVTV